MTTSMSSSSDDESPIAMPRRRIPKRASIDELSDEDIPLSKSVPKKTKMSENAASSSSDDDDDEEDDEEEEEEDFEDDDSDELDESSDDDVPLSSIVTSPNNKKKVEKVSKSATKPATATVKKKPTKKKASPTKKEKAAQAKKKKDGKNKKKEIVLTAGGSSNYVCASAELYSKSEKGKLVQALLCRWWYAMTWPDPSSLPLEPPKNADTLDGFPGVYIYTKGESVGKLLDLRDKSTCPCFNNFARKSASELQSLLLAAIQKQKEELILHEGKGTSTEKDLDTLAKWAAKVNTNKADKDALTVLKAANLTLSLI
jgi:hypothetical protein